MARAVLAFCALLVTAALCVSAGGRAAGRGADAGASGVRDVPGALVRRVQASGRAEASLERVVSDPLGGGRRTLRGRIALEPPDRADLRFLATGERIAVRSDGGEWIQPELRQVLLLGPERAAAARRWWEILLARQGEQLLVRRLAAGRFLIVAAAGQGEPADSAWVWLDRAGLPSRLEIREEPGERTAYRFSNWRFMRPRGRAAFVIAPPAGYEVVRLP